MEMSRDLSREERASKVATHEHDCIVEAMHVLEKALAYPVPGREVEWKQRAGAALAVVVDYIRQHVESAEADGGLLTEVEVKVGRTHDVQSALKDHELILENSDHLLRDLSEDIGDPVLPTNEVRNRTNDLSASLRQHQWREADLIMSVFDLDIGAGD
jgi:hypothetical protein